MALILLVLVVIVFSIFYFLLWLIYRKLFESQEQISIALTFVVSIGLVMLFVYPPMVFFYFLFFTLSYIIWWLIYRKLFKSQKHISKFLVVLGSIGLIMFYYTPYSFYLEPSYWEFRNMCKLNELPNNEEKYNKILSYFDTSLDTLDWEELNREAAKLDERSDNYIKDIVEYRVSPAEKKTRRIYGYVNLFAKNNGFAPQNLTKINVHGAWYTRRYHLKRESMASYNLTWFEDSIGCTYIIKRKFFQYQGDKQ